jgi:hypothetical protein
MSGELLKIRLGPHPLSSRREPARGNRTQLRLREIQSGSFLSEGFGPPRISWPANAITSECLWRRSTWRQRLRQPLAAERMVIDKTGPQGEYDFNLEFDVTLPHGI